MKLTVEKIISSGDGIGWADGKTFFVSYVIGGEEIEIIDYAKEKSYYRVTDYKLIKKSPQRRKPPCPNFTICGGCQFLHINYSHQKEIKIEILKELFKQKKIAVPEKISFITNGEFHQRTRAKIAVKDGLPAFKKRKEHSNITFKNCMLLHKEFNDLLVKQAESIIYHTPMQFEYSINSKNWMPDQQYLNKRVLDRDILISKGSFFQASEKGAELLVNEFLITLEMVKPKKVLDLFCGAGLFSVFSANQHIKTTGIESSAVSVRDFKRNLESKARIIKKDIYKLKELPESDYIIADPPRAGLGKSLSKIIANSNANNLTYVSCNPSTFVRDYEILIHSGFKITYCKIVDLFPSTNHFELFIFLQR